ncbi:aminoacyl-tRNA hydrolase [Bacillus sp. 1P06AnD]|uniref:aminoacyl-tRNA hydrolase n=1 Tax=Bacillus sp. 1P06AnD TaxID=3132208 RepID=UPI0039A133AC
MKLIVGLGNPGKDYERTRHNIGFEVIDELSKRWNITLSETKHKGLYGAGYVNGQKVILLKPLTYMNLSGESIRAVMDYFKIDMDDIVILYDDLDLGVGKIRLRQKGSAGGHNGIKSTIAHLGTQEFNRIRIGIGRPQNGMSITNYVLGRFLPEEWADLAPVIDHSAKACEAFLEKPFLQVMNSYN